MKATIEIEVDDTRELSLLAECLHVSFNDFAGRVIEIPWQIITPPIGARQDAWLPIETAPVEPFDQTKWFMRHSPRILLFVDGYTTIGCYSYTQKGKGRWRNSIGSVNPSHWMPLPTPPALPSQHSSTEQPDGNEEVV